MSRIFVPEYDEIAGWDTERLVAFHHALQEETVSLNETIRRRDQEGGDVRKLYGLIRHYERGAAIADQVLRVRAGEAPVTYTKPRPVHDFESAFTSLKAAMRLLGLLIEEHKQVGALLAAVDDDDDEAAFTAMGDTHDEVERALNAGMEHP